MARDVKDRTEESSRTHTSFIAHFPSIHPTKIAHNQILVGVMKHSTESHGAAAPLLPLHESNNGEKTPNLKETSRVHYESKGGTFENGTGHANRPHEQSNGAHDMSGAQGGKANQNGNSCLEGIKCQVSAPRLAEWKAEIQDIPERCDLSGLTCDPVKFQLAATGVLNEVLAMKERSIEISGDLLQHLRATVSKRRMPPDTLLLVATHQMLAGFGHGTHTVTATFRTHTESEPSCGCPEPETWMVLSNVVNHVGRDDNKYMSSAISEVQTSSATSGETTCAELVAPSELVRSELLDLVVVLHAAPIHEAPLPDFPLILAVSFHDSSWTLTMRYAHGLFDIMVVDSLLGAMRTLLEATTRPTQLLRDIQLLPQEQIAQMDAWNNTSGDYPSSKRLNQLVEEAAARFPDRIAVICGDKLVTYAELNAQANRLGGYLCSRGIQPEQLIALFLDKSEMMIEAIIGVWKSGAAHVPIDPSYPVERIQFVLDDVKTGFIIANERHVSRLRNDILGERQMEIIPLEPLLKCISSEGEKSSFSPQPSSPTGAAAEANLLQMLPLASKQLAYVTYTSGTTGFPKGIFKEHTSVVNSITDLAVRYRVAGNADEVILLFSAYVFEPFVRQMLMALTTGNKLAVISDEDKFDQAKLLGYIREHKVTYINGTASVLQEYDFSTCPSLKRIILVGENLTDSRYNALRRRFKGTILSEYGFTESAFVTALKVFEPGSKRVDMSLGQPVRNVQCYILDANMKRVPLGVAGELHVGGLGISRGYMNREELTRQKFLPNPYQTAREKESGRNGRLYKTGDLARWLPSGEVEYLGRIDFQIKLRGIRIEPGEIESTLALYPGIRTSIVLSKKLYLSSGGRELTSQDHLVGYFVCDEKSTLSEHQILSFLDRKLPRYMIPTRLIQLPGMPVTINGKVDLRALPTVEVAVPTSGIVAEAAEAAAAEAAAAAPLYRDGVDEKLATIWGNVLGILAQSISLEHNFFRLGGHSITCIQLIARVRKVFGTVISLEEVFQTRTLRAMADMLRSRLAESSHGQGIVNGVVESDAKALTSGLGQQQSYLANSLQQGFVYHSLKTQQTDAYIMQSVLEYEVPIRQDVYRAAWEHVHRQHPALRIRFSWEDEVVQILGSESTLDWRVIDAAGPRTEAEMQHRIEQVQRDDHEEGYRLSEASLIRVYFLQTSGPRSYCIFSCHHSVLDGWSLPLLFERLHDAYICLADGVQPPEEEDSAYALAQIYLETHRDDHLKFWAGQMNQIEERCDLNALLNEASRYKVPLADYDRIQEQGEQSIFLAGDDAMQNLLEECSAMGVTLHSILQLVWHLVLHAYGGGSHTVTGTTISGRNLPVEGIESSIGLFINTLPLVVDHSSYRDMTAIEAIAQIQNQVNAMNSRGNLELGRLSSKDDLKHGLFDTLFVLESYPNLDTSRRLRNEQLVKCTVTGGTEKLSYPLAVIAQEKEHEGGGEDGHGRGCNLTICYARELFTDNTIKVLLLTARDTLNTIAKNRHTLIRDMEYLSIDQVQKLDKWNATEDEYPGGTLHSVFEIEAQRRPDKVAVIYEDKKLTYRELNGRANALAFYLLDRVAIEPNRLIALVMDKSEHLITSILAVWKSGGAYVPIDPGYPDDRILFILEDTAAMAVIADGKYADRLARLLTGRRGAAEGAREERANGPPVIPSDTALNLSPSPTHPRSRCHAADLAYVMYTSGTTGKPKGVMVEHHGVVNLAVSLSKIFGLRDTDDEVILSFSNYVFDHFVEQMTDALLNGQTLLVLNDEMRGDKERLYRYMKTNRVTYLSGTPSVISMYEFSCFGDHLRRIDCVGEAFSEPVFDKIRETFPGLVINGYGPTEVSITTHKRLYPYPERRTNKSIGRQVANSTSYVLNEDMKRVPIGAVGELYLGGDGVARGYHNRADLTRERFPPNPFQTETERREGRNARLYRTGDLVRWLESADGEVEYLGRNDFQVKIRGQRIELGEIEAVLSAYPGVVQSVVLARDRVSDGQKYLVGYYVSSGSLLSPQAIRRYMQARLPSHMVPARTIPMEKFPVTVSGKLDTKALPAPDETVSEEDAVVPPRTEVERVVAGIWADLLETPIENIGIHNDFFSLGGDSLRSTKLSFAATKALGVSVSVSSLFRYPTIEAFARWVVSGSAVDAETISPLTSEQLATGVPLSPAQERLLFLHEYDENENKSAYNIAMHLELNDAVCLEAFEKSLRSMVGRHEALRTLLVKQMDDATYRQRILDVDAGQRLFSLKMMQLDSEAQLHREMSNAAQHAFRLDRELPFMAVLLQGQIQSECRHAPSPSPIRFATLVFHHSAFDAWSWGVFCSDVAELYAFHDGQSKTANLPELRVQYKEYAVEHRQGLSTASIARPAGAAAGQITTATTHRFKVLSEFWSARLTGLEPVCLITDKPRPADFNYNGRDVRMILGEDVSLLLRSMAKREGASLYAVMLATYCYLLHVYTMQSDISVGIPVAHRNRAEYESVVGFFVNLLPLRVDVANLNVHELVAHVQKQLVESQVHMDMPFQEMTKLVHEQHDPSRHPLVQTVFNWEVQSPSDSATRGKRTLFREYVPSSPLATAAKFDLNATVKEMGDSSLEVNFNYPLCLFEEDTIRGYMASYIGLLKRLASAPTNQLLSQITLVDDLDQLGHIAHTAKVSPYHIIESAAKTRGQGSTLHALFESHAARSPTRTAIVGAPDQKVSYADLNTRANQLAHYMTAQQGICTGDRVALMLDKKVEMLICILAVWKAGATYVPLDPSYPEQRVSFILHDTEARLLLTSMEVWRQRCSAGRDEEIAAAAPTSTRLVIVDDPSTLECVERQSPANATQTDVESSMLAYIIYTSGTTGKPKGVMVEHDSVAALQSALSERYFGATPHDTHSVLFLSNYVFDFSIEQIVLSILSGNTMVLPPDEGVTHESFYELAGATKLSYLSGTPSVLQQIQLSRLKNLRIVTAAGEEFHPFQFAHMRRQFTGRINNAYGVTETTVYNLVTTFEHDAPFTKELCDELPGSRVYVLSDALQQVPLNAVGELYLAGGCVARGYLNQDELTRERFISNPFYASGEPGFERMYKTGDLVRYRGPGRLEYLGRRDQQIKLRGVRIELSEIQTALASIPGVQDAAVLPIRSQHERNERPSGTVSELVGYYNTDNDSTSLTPDAIRRMLSSVLPSFMIPNRLQYLQEALPVTINGKLDTRKLASLARKSHSRRLAAPRNIVEAKLCLLWAAAMGKASSGIDDDLYTNGGDSISSMQLVGDIYREFGRKVSVKDVFMHRTVRSMFDNVFSHEGEQDLLLLPPLRADQGFVTGIAPLLPIQTWFLSKKLQKPEYWNHCFTIRTPLLDVGRLTEAVKLLQLRHDALRMRIETRNGKSVQTFSLQTTQTVEISTCQIRGCLSGESDRIGLENELSKRQSSFNMAEGPLFTIVYLHGYKDGSARVWCSFHHLIMDTISWNIIRSDLQLLYQGADLGMKSSSIQQWAVAIEKYAPSCSERRYWEIVREKAERSATLARTERALHGCWARCEDNMSVEETASLFQQCCLSLQVTMHEILLMSVGAALQEEQQVPGEESSVVTIEGHGREESVDLSLDVSRTVGWFTSMYPFEIPRVSDPIRGVMDVKDHVDKVPNHGVGYGACYGYTDGSLPLVSVNYLGRLDQGQQRRRDDWTLAVDESGMSAGLYTAPEDKDVSSSVLDITFAAVNGRLSIQIGGALAHEALQGLINTMKSTLRQLISQVKIREQDFDFQRAEVASVTDQGDFTPFISFGLDGDDEEGNRRDPILFLLPPGEGGAESYLHNIVRGLPHRKLVVFNNHYRHNKALSTFEQLADYYISLIRTMQPRGPYHILGWSFGGIVAMEMAQRLAHRGERLGTVALIDAYFDVPGAMKEAFRQRDEGKVVEGKEEEEKLGILDVIYSIYRPDRSNFLVLEGCTDRLILFKATRAEKTHGTPEQRRLYRWYAEESALNRLDVFVSREAVDLVLLDGSHFDWVYRGEEVSRMCALLEGCLDNCGML
ncbi:NRPS protein [Claviceps maximensis]|nr:NRPS protein [Claviceps maximensis]